MPPSMKKSAFLLSLLMLLVPFAGCASSDLDKHLIENRTVTIEPGGADLAYVEAVSYTHLTLPTIYSV